ncbi:hypothetical protein [Undibacterium macrobrachii]|nr:hypothetical protein [Undibacterium macrobrachii]
MTPTNHRKNAVYFFSFVLMALVVSGLIYTLEKKEINSQEVAGWVQAVGSIAAIYAGFFILVFQQKDRDQQAKNEMKQVIRCLADEVRTVTAIARNGMGAKLLQTPSGDYYPYTVPINESPFPIFSSCAILVPKIENTYLREKIIVTYTTMQSVVVSFKMNNMLLAEYARASEVSARTNFHLDIQKAQNCLAALIDYLPKLQGLYREAIKHAEELETGVKTAGL